MCFFIIQKEVTFYYFSSPYNTLYLELHCPAVAPSVVVTSNNGKNTVDFGDVAVGMKFEFKFWVFSDIFFWVWFCISFYIVQLIFKSQDRN